MSKLEIHRGKRFYKEYVLPDTDVIVIGRTHSSDVVLPDESRRVSRMHAALVRVSAGNIQYFIRDLGSAHGTYVNGSPFHQRVLNDNDTIGIGNYRLVFSGHAQQAQPRMSHLKIRRSGGGGSGSDASTSILKVGTQGDLRFTPEQSELLEHLEHSFRRGTTPLACAADLVTALLRTIHADRGLIGVLPQSDAEIIDELGVTNLRHQDVIEISDADFAQHLRQGETVEDTGTVLVPFGPRANVLGFLCINRRDQRRTWTSKDMQFLQSVARLMPSSVAAVHASNSGVTGDEPMEWPIEMVGRTKEWLDVMEQIRLAADSQMNLLVLGETGSGKELVAKALHQRSSRRGGPFLARNCSQTTETLAESEIFGYAPKSGIAGADLKGASGWFELANGGTLFLDEVHRLTPAMQDKFLRVLQDKLVSRIGARSPVQTDVNVIAATDEDVRGGAEGERFREPFLFRFGKAIHVPPLRRRREDIPLLAFFFLDKYAWMHNSRARTISRRGVHFLWNYDWPGNVRQLENVIHGAVIRDHEVIFSWDLEAQLSGETKAGVEETAAPISTPPGSGASRPADSSKKPKSMEEVEKEHILEALEVTHGNVTRAAEILGYKSRQTILNKMDRYGIPRDYADPGLSG